MRDDLGALIGQIRLEAARRRSAPDYPLGDEIAVDAELRQWSPGETVGRLERLARQAEAAAQGEAVPSSRRAERTVGTSPELATVVAEALRTLSTRLADLEHRLTRMERGLAGGGAGPTALPLPAGAVPAAGRLSETLIPAGPGRVLCFADDPAPTVGELRGRGVDAYGLTPAGDEFLSGPDVRSGQLLHHLASVGDSALRAVVAVGLAAGTAGPGPHEVAVEIGRVAPLAVVLAESPWWWRTRQGATVELAPVRPLSPELWLEAFASKGMEVEAGYEDGGRAYRVVARR